MYRSIKRKIKLDIRKMYLNFRKLRSVFKFWYKDKYNGEICYLIKGRFEFININYCYGLL